MIIPWSASIRESVVDFIVTNALVFSLISFVGVAIGVAIATTLVLSTKHKTYRVRGGNKGVLVDEVLIQQYLDTYWEKIFPKKEIPNRLYLKNNKIHVQADLPFVPLEDQRDLLKQFDQDLTEMFDKVLGYEQDFLLSISFQNASGIRKNITA